MYLLVNSLNKYLELFKSKYTTAAWYFLIVTCCIFGVFLSTYRLTETPPTWMDEGIIIQVARNIWLNGKVVLQSAPGVFETGWYVTTSYPVTFPIAIAFDVFGQSLFVARSVMVIYLMLLMASIVIVGQLLARYYDVSTRFVTSSTLMLVVSFAPLYGQGKNVLGEIPGMFWLVLSAIFGLVYSKIQSSRVRYLVVFAAGTALGLAVATKPIYILALIATVTGFVYYLVYEYIRVKKLFFKEYLFNFLLVISGIMVPLCTWFNHQFNKQSLAAVWSVYSNPHHNELILAFWHNARLFFTEVQPLHTLLLFLAWSIGLALLVWNKKKVSIIECVAWFLSLGVLVAFLRTAGYYRYFFIAQFISLIFFAISITRLSSNIQDLFSNYSNSILVFSLKYGKYIIIVLLFTIQLYYMFTSSWIFVYKDSTRSFDLEKWVQDIQKDSRVFLYQTPEVATFLGSHEYYQYMKITQSLVVGEGAILNAKNAGADYFVLPQGYSKEVFPEDDEQYYFDSNVSRYEIWKRK